MTDTTVNMDTIIVPPSQIQDNIMPPNPPLLDERGTFMYVKETHIRQMLVNCWQAIQLTETWEFIKKDPGSDGFQFCNARERNLIRDKMEELPNSVGHSGASAGWTLRQMQFIGKYGENAFRERWINNN